MTSSHRCQVPPRRRRAWRRSTKQSSSEAPATRATRADMASSWPGATCRTHQTAAGCAAASAVGVVARLARFAGLSGFAGSAGLAGLCGKRARDVPSRRRPDGAESAASAPPRSISRAAGLSGTGRAAEGSAAVRLRPLPVRLPQVRAPSGTQAGAVCGIPVARLSYAHVVPAMSPCHRPSAFRWPEAPSVRRAPLRRMPSLSPCAAAWRPVPPCATAVACGHRTRFGVPLSTAVDYATRVKMQCSTRASG